MPKDSAIPPAVRRAWLEAHEGGKRIDVMAREAHRTERTVQLQLRRARQERDQQEIRTGLLREAYRQHYDDLLGIAQEVRGRAFRSDTEGILTFGERRKRMLSDALVQHLPDRRFVDACGRWDRCAREWAAIVQEGRARLPALVPSHLPGSAIAIEGGWIDGLWFALLETVRGNPLNQMTYVCRSEHDRWRLDWGVYGISYDAASEANCQAIQERHRDVVAIVTGEAWSPFRAGMRSLLRRWERARAEIDEQVETMLLQRLLPGDCYLCPPGATPTPVRRRRPRKTAGGDDAG